jgi:hypothetical protein
VVPLVNLVGSHQHLLVKNVQTFRKRDALLGKLFSHEIGRKNKFNLLAGVALHTNQALQVVTHLLHVLLIKAGLFLCRKETSKLSASILFLIYRRY